MYGYPAHQFSYYRTLLINVRYDMMQCRFVSNMDKEVQADHFGATVLSSKWNSDQTVNCSTEMTSNVDYFEGDCNSSALLEMEAGVDVKASYLDEVSLFLEEVIVR